MSAKAQQVGIEFPFPIPSQRGAPSSAMADGPQVGAFRAFGVAGNMRWILVGVGLVLFSSTVAFARTKEPLVQATRAGVEAALTKDGRKLVHADVKAMGKDADHVLIDIFRDGHAPVGLRGRAIDALAASGSVVARNQLVSIVKATQSEVELSLVRKALLGLGWLHDARIVANVGPWLAHDSAAVRLDAALALALSKNIYATDLLETHIRTEKDSDLKRLITRLIAINRAEQPPPRPAHRARIMPPQPLESRDSVRF